MTTLTRLRELLAAAEQPGRHHGREYDCREAARKALPALLRVAEAAKEVMPHMPNEQRPPVIRAWTELRQALAALEGGTHE